LFVRPADVILATPGVTVSLRADAGSVADHSRQRFKSVVRNRAAMIESDDPSVAKRRPPTPDRFEDRHRVVIVGGGFGGLEAVIGLAGAPVSVTLIDQRNYHLFQPLLYQVATASLATSEIAWPIRNLVRGRREVTTMLATVVGVDANARRVLMDDGRAVPYDTLVLATGARHAYFGHDEWEEFAPGLKTLEDATTVRRRILLAFERAEIERDVRRRAALLTFVIIGGGPTGMELAGTIAELARATLRPDFRNIDTRTARVVLIEAGPRVLAGFAEDLSAYAQRSLERLGVEVELGQPVSECSSDRVVFGGRVLEARTIIWAAGVRASSAADRPAARIAPGSGRVAPPAFGAKYGGTLTAIDSRTNNWQKRMPYSIGQGSGALVTASDVLFHGEPEATSKPTTRVLANFCGNGRQVRAQMRPRSLTRSTVSSTSPSQSVASRPKRLRPTAIWSGRSRCRAAQMTLLPSLRPRHHRRPK
jgi:thioredoxin reductase